MKYTPHKRGSELTHLQRADKLRAAGFNVKLSKRRHTPQQKSAVTRLFNQHAHFLNPQPGTLPVKFFATTAAQRRVAAKTLSSRALTPGGFWLQVPKGVRPRDYRVRVERGGVVERIKGRQNDRIVPISTRKIAKDPIKAFRLAIAHEEKRTGRKAKQAQLIVNGFQGKRVQSIKSMLYYLENSPRFSFETEDLDDDEFEDTFQLKLIYGQNKRGAKSRRIGKKRSKAVGRRGRRN